MAAIFLDANLPMYAAGRPHELRAPCLRVLDVVAVKPQAFATDAEVLQEMVHRYRSQGRWQMGRVAVEDFARLMRGRVEPVLDRDVLRCVELASLYPRADTRDLVHLAVMERAGCSVIVSADHDFDGISGVRRIDPRDAAEFDLVV